MSPWIRGDWMQTYTGRQFYPLNPSPDDISPLDIAHSLSMQCRFNGHVDDFYSVAEHCVLLSYAVSPKNALWALLHDATEVYVGDMIRPLKRYMSDYRDVEDRVMIAIVNRFGLSQAIDGPLIMPAEVAEADTRILLTERNALMSGTRVRWDIDDLEPLPVTINAWSPHVAKTRYQLRLHELGVTL